MTDEQTAAAIVADHEMSSVNAKSLEAAIVRALQAARDEAGRDGVVAGHMTRKAPPGHIIDDAGVVRRVLGTFVLTRDGCVWAHGAKVYWRDDPHEQSIENINDDIAFFEEHGTDAVGEVCGTWEKVSQCYSTREAAEAAKEEKK